MTPEQQQATYEAARAICYAAQSERFVLPDYTGSTSDLGYLRDWVLPQVCDIYKVDAAVFDQPTLLSTSILRDYVHRALYQITPDVPTESELPAGVFLGWDDVAVGLRYPIQGFCGLLSMQAWQVFRSFGYDARRVDSINGDVGVHDSVDASDYSYTQSHANTEVFLTDVGDWVIQDATYNAAYQALNGEFLSWLEARAKNVGEGIDGNGFHTYLGYQVDQSVVDGMRAGDEAFFKDHYLKVPWTWLVPDGSLGASPTNLFPDPLRAHDPTSFQGGTFESVADALAAFADVAGSWESVASALRASNKYVSGFAFTESSSSWITIRLASGEYVSVELGSGNWLYGSYDQLVNDATGGPGGAQRAVLNPGADLHGFLGPAKLLTYYGSVMDGEVPWHRAISQGSGANDVIMGAFVADALYGLGGHDEMYGAGGDDVLLGGEGNDFLNGGSGADYLIGGGGIDTASYSTAPSAVVARLDAPTWNTGEAAGDLYSGIENLYGTPFADTLCGNGLSNRLTGWSGNDALWGYGGGDVLDGGDGDDYLVGGNGADVFIGGAGTDTVSYYFAGAALMARLDLPARNTGEAAGDTYSGIENFFGSQFADTLCGNGLSNRLTGWSGNDSLWGYGGGDILDGGDGDDYLVGANGADVFIGGAGIDTVSYYFAAGPVIARLDLSVHNTGEAAGDTYSSIESLYGSQFGDTLFGDGQSNRLTGWGGNDSLLGNGGGDVLDGGDGDDYLYGRDGADVFIGGAGTDTVSYSLAAAGVTARFDDPIRNTGEAAGDSYSGIENIHGSPFADTLCGNGLSNRLTGWGGNDSLWGYGGGDVLDGGDGDDYLVGEAGADVFIGGAGFDTVSYYFAGAGVTVRLDRPGSNTGEAAGDTYSGIENVYGSQFADVLAGNSVANVLTGWGGADTFVFATAPNAGNVDTIADFQRGIDRIALDHGVFSALTPGALPASAFALGSAATDAFDRILYDPTTGAIAYDSDGAGGSGPVQFALVGTSLALSSSDFFIV